MVSGEEGALPGSSWETYKCSQGGGSFSQYTAGSRGGMDSGVEGPLGSGAEEEGGFSGQSGRRASTGMPAMEWQLQLQAENYQPEQISLDSEDSYPPMVLDLDSVDTIDVGVFVEYDCSSPVNSNFDSEEQIDSALLSGVGSSPSEYVKQWVTGNTVQEDTTNSGQNRTIVMMLDFTHSFILSERCPIHKTHAQALQTHAKMKLLLALCAVWNIIQLSEGCSSGEMTDRLTCVSDYWFTITCTLSITDEPVGVNNTHYWLNFTWADGDRNTFRCPLVVMGDSYGCTFVADFDKNLTYHGSSFNTMDCFNVRLCYNIDCQSNYDNLTDFEPSQNIQPTAPSHLAVQWTPKGYRCTWQSGYEHHEYMTDFRYQLSFYKYHGGRGEVFHVSSQNNSLLIDGSGLEPNTTYVLKVRSYTKTPQYKGQWSPWSALVQLRTDAKEAEPTIVLVLSQIVFPVCVIAGVLLFVFYNPTTRMKIKALYDVPSPGPFFHPLYKDYNKRFQDWLESECNLIPPYQTEEFLTIDTLIIEAKPIAEDQDCSATTPYPLAQGHTPYVSPSVMDWVCSHSPNGNGPGDIPYTQLPCSPLELQFGGIVTSFSQDQSVACEGDSECEDLTLSPDSSLPNRPVSSEPECICTDYCILHETSKGFIPTVVPKELSTHPLKSYCIVGPGKEETCATK